MDWNIKLKEAVFFGVGMIMSTVLFAQPCKVEILKNESGYFLQRNGEPYYIKGAGAKAHFKLLNQSGANSIRIWNSNNDSFLDSAHKYNMTVALGLYVRPERSGMNYNDQYAVQGQIEQLKTEVLRLKDHPALLVWGIGNEIDLRYSNFKVWETIEEIAKFIKKVDPNHPTMTVIAGIDPSKIFMIKKYCPSVDILGLNVYGAIENAADNVRKYNWEKPYIVSEWGVNGPFETKSTSWGAKIEPPNGVKASDRLRRYTELIKTDTQKCLGSYCFLWGQKQESTATWHGMFLSNGFPTEAIDVMHYCWTQRWPSDRAPSITNIFLNELKWQKEHFLAPNTKTNLVVDFMPYNNKDVYFEYHLFPEAFTNKIGGDRQRSPKEIELNILSVDKNKISFMTPKKKGAYRIFAYVKNKNNQYSVANVPFFIE